MGIFARMTDLNRYLQDQKINQIDFAEQIQSTQATVSRYASGKQMPTLEQAWAIEKATGGAVGIYSWLNQEELKAFREQLQATCEAAE